MRAANPGQSIPVPLKVGPSITVTIINYRTAAMTIDCLRSVVDDMNRAAVAGQVIVVDNRSDDGSAEAIEAWIAGEARAVPIRLVRSATNSGYSGGHNQGMAAAPADLVLFDPAAHVTVDRARSRSLSANNPWHGIALDGAVQATFLRGRATVLDGEVSA